MTVDFSRATEFVLNHGRLLDRRRFDVLFGDGDRDSAVQLAMQALLAFQNPDGGFGNAIESDVRCSASQTVGAEVALRTMCELGTTHADAVQALCAWCSANATDGSGLPFALPTIVTGPRAPWWQPTEGPDLNPTAAIVGLATRLGIEQAWIDRARSWCWSRLETNVGEIDHHAALCVLEFLAGAPADARTEATTDAVRRRVVDDLVELDPAAEGYVFPPLQFARRPDAIARPWFDDATIDRHLDALAAGQLDDGGWTVAWQPPSSAALSEWRAIATIDALETLRSYGRL